MARPFLPVIKTITLDDGTQLDPADELRISTGLEAEAVEEDGRTWIRLSAESTSFLVPQGDVLAAGPATRRFVLAAAPRVAIPISLIQFIPHGTTLQSDTVYARFTVEEYDASGAHTRYILDPYYGTNVQDFNSMQTSIYFTLNDYTLPLGSTVVVEWSKIGGGTDVLGGTWILT